MSHGTVFNDHKGFASFSHMLNVCDSYFDLDNIHSSKTMSNNAKICLSVIMHPIGPQLNIVLH